MPGPTNPYNCDIEACDDCGEHTLLLDEEPSDLIVEDGSTLMRFPVPDGLTLDTALRISAAVREGRATDPLEKLIFELTAGLVASMELLSRIVVYGVDGTGDVDLDDEDLRAAMLAAHDYCRVFGAAELDGAVVGVQLDASNFLCFIPDGDAAAQLPDGVTVYSPSSPFEA